MGLPLPQTTSHAANNQSCPMPPASLTYLDQERILQETFVARMEYHPTLTSTNDRAAQAAAEGARELPLLIVADRQTAGRGRGGHRWWSDAGGLTMSLLLEPELFSGPGQSRAPLVALAAAVAVVETLTPLLPDHPVGLHWPNDVLVGSRKLAGILIEVLPDGRHVVGIGVNTNNSLADAPPTLQTQATTLRDLTGRPHNQTSILIALLRALERNFAALASDGPRIAARADALCSQRGRTLTVEHGRRAVTGVCLGIAPDGALRWRPRRASSVSTPAHCGSRESDGYLARRRISLTDTKATSPPSNITIDAGSAQGPQDNQDASGPHPDRSWRVLDSWHQPTGNRPNLERHRYIESRRKSNRRQGRRSWPTTPWTNRCCRQIPATACRPCRCIGG